MSVRVAANIYGLSNDFIPDEVLDVVKRLKQEGHRSWIVGGCVRDLILSQQPKDFDLVTSARPQAVRHIFKKARVIGKRFKLVHVPCASGRVVEVSTLRSGEEGRPGQPQNCYGNDLKEDAERRDFRLNALYYDPESGMIEDYVRGLEAVQNYRLDTIKDASRVLTCDPIRIVRALLLAAKLPVLPCAHLQQQMQVCAPELLKVSSGRKYHQLDKVLHSGYALSCFENMHQLGVLSGMVPDFSAYMCSEKYVQQALYLRLALAIADHKVRCGQHFRNAFIWAAWLWTPYRFLRQHKSASLAATETLRLMVASVHIPKRECDKVRILWQILEAMHHEPSEKTCAWIGNRYFDDCMELLRLQADVGWLPRKRVKQWHEIRAVSWRVRMQMIKRFRPLAYRKTEQTPRSMALTS